MRKNSWVPCVASPSPTMCASPTIGSERPEIAHVVARFRRIEWIRRRSAANSTELASAPRRSRTAIDVRYSVDCQHHIVVPRGPIPARSAPISTTSTASVLTSNSIAYCFQSVVPPGPHALHLIDGQHRSGWSKYFHAESRVAARNSRGFDVCRPNVHAGTGPYRAGGPAGLRQSTWRPHPCTECVNSGYPIQ